MGILVTDTTLRDAHQSLIATRMRTRDMLPVLQQLDKVGFFSLEVWGGATFDTCIRFLNEDPWERLVAIRHKVKNTRLQMLLRGQNLVGYRHYADDVVREFIRLAVKNGVDIFRIFDALNDVRNMELSIKVAKDLGAHVQGTICYTTSPVHNTAAFAGMAVKLERLGCDSICIKDMAGLISPLAATELVAAIKKKVKVPINLHSHCSSGMAPVSYYAAAIAGIDILDTAFSPLAWGTSQPPTEGIAAAFRGTPYDTGLDLGLLYEIAEYFSSVAGKYRSLFTAETTCPSVSVLLHQIPGGMLSNLVSQLKEQNALGKLSEVLQEVPRVRADLGYPPLVTPTSQVVGIQAVMNVLAGGRYTKVTREVKDYLLGYYGRPPGVLNKEVRKQVVGEEPVINVRPADLLAPEMDKARSDGTKLGFIHKEEDAVTYALYPQVAMKFLRGESKEEVLAADKPVAHTPDLPAEFSVDVDGEVFSVKVSSVVGKAVKTEKPKKATKETAGALVSPLGGMILAVVVKVGDAVRAGDTVIKIEAMKMQSEVHASHAGIVKEILAFEGEQISTGDVLMVVTHDGK